MDGYQGGEMMDIEDRLECEDERGGQDGEGEQGRESRGGTLRLALSLMMDKVKAIPQLRESNDAN